jgi:hypothetical protein
MVVVFSLLSWYAQSVAESGMDWTTIVGAVAGTLCGAGGYHLVNLYLKFRRGNYDLEKARRRDRIEEYDELLAAGKADRDELRARINDVEETSQKEIVELRNQVNELHKESVECRIDYAAAIERITSLEDACTGAGIKFRPWAPRKRSQPKPNSPGDSGGG